MESKSPNAKMRNPSISILRFLNLQISRYHNKYQARNRCYNKHVRCSRRESRSLIMYVGWMMAWI